MRALHAPQVSPEHTAASIGRLSHSRAKGVALCRACNEHLVNSFTHVAAQSCITFHRGHLPAAPPPMSAMRPAPRVSSPRADYCACSLQVPKGFLYKKITLPDDGKKLISANSDGFPIRNPRSAGHGVDGVRAALWRRLGSGCAAPCLTLAARHLSGRLLRR